MYFVYNLKTGAVDDEFVRVVAKNVDEAIRCLRCIRGVKTQVIEADREYMGLGLSEGRDGKAVDYVAGIDDV